MAQDAREGTCEQRLPEHRESRLSDFRDFDTLAGLAVYEGSGSEAHKAAERLDIELDAATADELRDAAYERMSEYPLGVSSKTVFRIDLSTGGPGDWLEVECSGDTPRYEPAGEGEHYEVETITYHFSDWFDHAQDTLTGDDFDVAARFAAQVVPELID